MMCKTYLTIVVSMNTNKNEFVKIVEFFVRENLLNCKVLFINDNPDFEVKYNFNSDKYFIINNIINMGKF